MKLYKFFTATALMFVLLLFLVKSNSSKKCPAGNTYKQELPSRLEKECPFKKNKRTIIQCPKNPHINPEKIKNKNTYKKIISA